MGRIAHRMKSASGAVSVQMLHLVALWVALSIPATAIAAVFLRAARGRDLADQVEGYLRGLVVSRTRILARRYLGLSAVTVVIAAGVLGSVQLAGELPGRVVTIGLEYRDLFRPSDSSPSTKPETEPEPVAVDADEVVQPIIAAGIDAGSEAGAPAPSEELLEVGAPTTDRADQLERTTTDDEPTEPDRTDPGGLTDEAAPPPETTTTSSPPPETTTTTTTTTTAPPDDTTTTTTTTEPPDDTTTTTTTEPPDDTTTTTAPADPQP